MIYQTTGSLKQPKAWVVYLRTLPQVIFLMKIMRLYREMLPLYFPPAIQQPQHLVLRGSDWIKKRNIKKNTKKSCTENLNTVKGQERVVKFKAQTLNRK